MLLAMSNTSVYFTILSRKTYDSSNLYVAGDPLRLNLVHFAKVEWLRLRWP